jgi:hypothetical protein
MKRIALFLFLILSVITCFAQTQIDPTYQIQWNLLSGSGAPSITCTQNGNYTVYPYGAEWGQSYQDTTNNVEYKCTTSGWVKNLPTTGGTLTGALSGTSASFSGNIVASTMNLTPNAASAAYYIPGTTDVAQAIMAAASASTNGRVDATGFPSGSYTITHTLAVPVNTIVDIGPGFNLVCNMVGIGACLTVGDGGTFASPGRNSNASNITEGPLFNGTPVASAIGSSKLTVTGVSVASGVLTLTTTGYSGGNIPSGLSGQNVTLWGMTEKWLNGLEGVVTSVSGTSFSMAINAYRPTYSAAETGYAWATPYPLVSAASGAGTQQSFSLDGLSLRGSLTNTNPIGHLLDVQGVFIPTTFRNITTYYCPGGCVRVHPGTTQSIATDILFDNLQANDESNIDHPGCIVDIDAMDQTLAGSGVANITFHAGAIQYPKYTPMVCIDGNGLFATHSIRFTGVTDLEIGDPSGGVHAGVNYKDVSPIQITDASDIDLGDAWFSGFMPAETGGPTGIVEITSTVSNIVSDINIHHLTWPNSTNGWGQNPIGIVDNVMSSNPTPSAYNCCWNSINQYAPNYQGTKFTDTVALIPHATPPETPVEGEFYYDSTLNRPSYYDGAQFQRGANLNDLSPYLLGATDLLAGSGQFSSSSGGIATGWSSTACAGPILACTYSISTSDYPAASGSTNTQVVTVVTNTGFGGGIGIAKQINIVAGQAYTISVYLKQDSSLNAHYILAITDVTQGTSYCGSLSTIATIPTTWGTSAITVNCTATSTVTGAYLRLIAVPATSATGNFYINFPTVLTPQGFTSAGSPVCSIGAGGAGAALCTGAQIAAAIGSSTITNAANSTNSTNVGGIPGTSLVANAGCGGTQSHCLTLAGPQTATTMTGSYVALTGSSYSLAANTLSASGCVVVSTWAHHSAGSTASTLRVYVGAYYAAVTGPTTSAELVFKTTYCNISGTAAGGQTISADSGYANGGFGGQSSSISQASIGALVINVQVTAASGDTWQLDQMRVELVQ